METVTYKDHGDTGTLRIQCTARKEMGTLSRILCRRCAAWGLIIIAEKSSCLSDILSEGFCVSFTAVRI